jgi:hypothetical protein
MEGEENEVGNTEHTEEEDSEGTEKWRLRKMQWETRRDGRESKAEVPWETRSTRRRAQRTRREERKSF